MTQQEDYGELAGMRRVLVVSEGGGRLDRWLAAHMPDSSRSQIRRWIDDNRVMLRGRPLKASYRPRAGDAIVVLVPPVEAYAVEPEPIPLDVLYEDADLLVVNKPAGMVVHPAAGNWHGTLVNAVLHHCPDLEGVGGVQRPGIVHRLDKDTSGVILVAKNDASLRALQEQFQARQVQKTYLALVFGWVEPDEGEVSAPIGRHPRHRKRMAVVPAHRGRQAVTRYQVLGRYLAGISRDAAHDRFTLLACHPLTGRTHQIRVHLAYAGHPIVGDLSYAGRRRTPFPLERQFLHAAEISFVLPRTGEAVRFRAALPPDLQAVLDGLTRQS